MTTEINLDNKNSTPTSDVDSEHLKDSERGTDEILGSINSPDCDRKNGILADDPEQLLGLNNPNHCINCSDSINNNKDNDEILGSNNPPDCHRKNGILADDPEQLLGLHDSNHRIHRSDSIDKKRRKWIVWICFSISLILNCFFLGVYIGMTSVDKGSDNNAAPNATVTSSSHYINSSQFRAGTSKIRIPQTAGPTSAPTKHINPACTNTGYFTTNSDNFPHDGRGLTVLVGFNNVTSNFMVHWEHNSSPDQLTITDTCSGNELFTTGMVPNGGYHLVTNNTCSVIEAKMDSPPNSGRDTNSGWEISIYCGATL